MLFKNKIIIILNMVILLMVYLVSQKMFTFSNLSKKYIYQNCEKFETINCYYSRFRLNEIILFYRANYIKEERINDLMVYYYFSPLLDRQISSDEKTFNLQIIINKDKMQIAYPINYLSF